MASSCGKKGATERGPGDLLSANTDPSEFCKDRLQDQDFNLELTKSSRTDQKCLLKIFMYLGCSQKLNKNFPSLT